MRSNSVSLARRGLPWRLLPAVAAGFCAIAFAEPGLAAEGAAPEDGVWELSLPRSGPHRQIEETLTIAHENGVETYSAKVVAAGKVAGIRYAAKVDGGPAPIFDLVTGAIRGSVTVTAKLPNVTAIVLSYDGPTTTQRGIEHWLSNDGKSLISLQKTADGSVTDILVFERRTQP